MRVPTPCLVRPVDPAIDPGPENVYGWAAVLVTVTEAGWTAVVTLTVNAVAVSLNATTSPVTKLVGLLLLASFQFMVPPTFTAVPTSQSGDRLPTHTRVSTPLMVSLIWPAVERSRLPVVRGVGRVPSVNPEVIAVPVYWIRVNVP